ncbi:MAG: stage II sporulation protein M [Thermodesulfobacteriota bacterium]
MMRSRDLLEKALLAAVEKKRLIVFFLMTHAAFLFFGMLTMSLEMPAIAELHSGLMEEIQDVTYLKPLTGALAPYLTLKILYTFSFNLMVGAFISTTLTGPVFFIPCVIAVWRSFIIGVLYYGMEASPLMPLVFFGTALFEFTAYSLGSALGTDLGLSLLLPGRKGTTSRREALGITFREGIWLYVLIVILLLIGAIWEISWLHYLGASVPSASPAS